MMFKIFVLKMAQARARIRLVCCNIGEGLSASEDSYEKSFNLKLSGNEVYYTNNFISLVKNMLCSKLHCQKVLI